MNVEQELVNTISELVEVKTELKTRQLKSNLKRLSTQSKMYKKLSDIEQVLSRIECHSNEQLKLNRFMAKMLYYEIRLRPYSGGFKDHDKVTNDFWKEYCRIAD